MPDSFLLSGGSDSFRPVPRPVPSAKQSAYIFWAAIFADSCLLFKQRVREQDAWNMPRSASTRNLTRAQNLKHLPRCRAQTLEMSERCKPSLPVASRCCKQARCGEGGR